MEGNIHFVLWECSFAMLLKLLAAHHASIGMDMELCHNKYSSGVFVYIDAKPSLWLQYQICNSIGEPKGGLVGYECCSNQWTKYFTCNIWSGSHRRVTWLVYPCNPLLSSFTVLITSHYELLALSILYVWFPISLGQMVMFLVLPHIIIKNLQSSPYKCRCEPFDTYPRTYDLLHAVGLFTVEDKRCSHEHCCFSYS